ncbi:MAG: LysE family transporter [Hyphomicrobiales bacterium]
MIEKYYSAIVFCAIVLGTPGPAVIALFSSGINYGFYKTLPFFIGILTGFLLNLTACALLIGSTFYISRILLFVFKIISLGYIVYISYKIATSPILLQKSSARSLSFFQGFLLDLLNPKAYIASFSSLSVFLIKTEFFISIIIIIVINMVISIILQGAWIILGERLGPLFRNSFYNRMINIVLALVMVFVVVASLVR